MLNEYIRFSPQYDFIIKLMISLIFTCALGPFAVNISGFLPITLQTLFILLFAIAFGWQIGGLNAFMYILLGMAGLPVFAGHIGGYEQMSAPSIGFYFGFVAGALVTGFIAELNTKRNPFLHIMTWFIGHLVILALGGYWLQKFRPENWWDDLVVVMPGAAVKSAFGFLILQLLLRFFLGRKEFYNLEKK